MIASFAWVCLLSPVDLVDLSINRKVFPERSESWDRIGFFKLREGEKERLVLLYQYDTDSVARKMLKKEGFATQIYPNFFSLHAVFQDGEGKWIHKELYAVCRVGFVGVKKSERAALVLEFRPKFMSRLDLKPGEDLAEAIKCAEKINVPFSRTLSLVNGSPTLK